MSAAAATAAASGISSRAAVKTPFPDRGDCCLDTGHYLLNLAPCPACGKRLPPVETGRMVEEEEDDEAGTWEETVTFRHACGHCGHDIGEHYWSFSVDATHQHYHMSCVLCGRGGDRRRLDSGGSAAADGNGGKRGDARGVAVKEGTLGTDSTAAALIAKCEPTETSAQSQASTQITTMLAGSALLLTAVAPPPGAAAGGERKLASGNTSSSDDDWGDD